MRETAADIWSKSHWDKVAPQLFCPKEYYDIVSIEYITVPDRKELNQRKILSIKDEDVEISELVKESNKLKGTIKDR